MFHTCADVTLDENGGAQNKWKTYKWNAEFTRLDVYVGIPLLPYLQRQYVVRILYIFLYSL